MTHLVIFVLVVAVSVVILLLLQRLTKLEFVSHARLLWKTWSIWLGSLGTTLTAICYAFPDAAIAAWSYLPDDVKSTLPPSVVSFIGPFLMFMGLLSQFVKQHKLAEQNKNG